MIDIILDAIRFILIVVAAIGFLVCIWCDLMLGIKIILSCIVLGFLSQIFDFYI